MVRAPDHGHSAHRATENAEKTIHISPHRVYSAHRVYRATRKALRCFMIPRAHSFRKRVRTLQNAMGNTKVMECRYTTPTGGSVPEWERKAKYPPEPRDRASRASRAARLPESTQIIARRAMTSLRGALRAAR